ncbi:hypothetical protein [Mesorhizobium sp. B2-3-5]|uniref:hypothetical protein n=1 Tax=Mesorhizobium sp. B2-3-5 TaxID=2589958 RepID=UPI001FED793D|nr:hypothetical protein [Mesorhizobium sp. B2-3-5]
MRAKRQEQRAEDQAHAQFEMTRLDELFWGKRRQGHESIQSRRNRSADQQRGSTLNIAENRAKPVGLID